jgi:hypothetical protein
MANKKYASYAEIEHDLAILKIEKEIHYQKMVFSFEKAKASILPSESVSVIENLYQKLFSGSLGTVIKFIFPYLISWFLNRKRG